MVRRRRPQALINGEVIDRLIFYSDKIYGLSGQSTPVAVSDMKINVVVAETSSFASTLPLVVLFMVFTGAGESERATPLRYSADAT